MTKEEVEEKIARLEEDHKKELASLKKAYDSDVETIKESYNASTQNNEENQVKENIKASKDAKAEDKYIGKIVNVKITGIKTWSLDGEIVL